ncbi:hypothetical protein KIN20_006314 [Parelaphostrongylus tenuis]|uniref:Uncharacterized protein n=1 Tax=Parelaphostrongylus tenuis TaxID=148309 RepID=A0AAD5M4K8_PARTN|nr:hypothetical protein KIN20_006314 [Parelaphostrongylus tenuis]
MCRVFNPLRILYGYNGQTKFENIITSALRLNVQWPEKECKDFHQPPCSNQKPYTTIAKEETTRKCAANWKFSESGPPKYPSEVTNCLFPH